MVGFPATAGSVSPSVEGGNPWLGLLAVVVVVGLYLGLQVGAAIFLGASAFLQNPSGDPGDFEALINESGLFPTITFNAGWIAILGLMVFAGPASPATRLGWRRIAWLPAAYWSTGALLIAVLLGWASQWIPDERTMEAVRALLEGVTNPAALVILVVVMAPFLEELLFRGYVYEAWVGRIGLPLTLLVTSLLFMGCHFHHGPEGLITTFGLGVLLGILRWKTGSVIPCVAVHAIYNLVAVVFSRPGISECEVGRRTRSPSKIVYG
ncbi:MAG: type II CAAX endopeptidase family protein [Terrimicrobiaceae bacterium]